MQINYAYKKILGSVSIEWACGEFNCSDIGKLPDYTGYLLVLGVANKLSKGNM
jgi:hypothetical protein